jgi:hypothetical protein
VGLYLLDSFDKLTAYEGRPTVVSAISGQYCGLALTIPKSHIACHGESSEKGWTEAFLDEVRADGRLSRHQDTPNQR